MKKETTMPRKPLDFQIAVAQMRTVPGNIRLNLERMLGYIKEARKAGARLVVFPELSVSGYLLGDRWEHNSFILEIEEANDTIRKASAGLTVIWGSVRADWQRIGEDGKVRKYNAAFVAHNKKWVRNGNGKLLGWVPKTNLPKYRVFDDARHFYPAGGLAIEMNMSLEELLQPFEVKVDGHVLRLAIAVCEDLWEDEYATKPSIIYGAQSPDLLVDISQSPWTLRKWHAREGMLRRRSRDAKTPILYVNSVGLQNNGKNLIWFDGSSSFITKESKFAWRAPQHKEGLFFTSLLASVSIEAEERREDIAEIFDAMISAMREFFEPFPRVVVGLSGGIDSALKAALLVEAIGADRVLTINMPTKHNSRTTRRLAEKCAKNLGVEYRPVSIQGSYSKDLRLLRRAGYPNPSEAVKENIQARIRGKTLADIAACEGGVFTCNGNKTEVALNYFTLYGDGAGAAAFLADLWKGQVYALARFINARAGKELIPQGIIDLIPSAELSAEQNVDEGKGDPIFYPYHDELLRVLTEHRWDPTMALRYALAGKLEQKLGCPVGTIKKYFRTHREMIENLEWVWRLYNIEYKRVQSPPGFLTSRRAFGFDRRDTIASAYFTKKYFRLKKLCLQKAL